MQKSGLQSILRDGEGRVVAIAQSRYMGDPAPTLTVTAGFMARIRPVLEQLAAQEQAAAGVRAMTELRPSALLTTAECRHATAACDRAMAILIAASTLLLLHPTDSRAISNFICAQQTLSAARAARLAACGF